MLMLTAKDGDYDQTDAFDLGADDYVTKPFSTPVLLARLQALARRGAPERPAALSAGGLSLDPRTRTVVREGREIQLTAREYALLHHLMRKVRQVQSKAEILENVWDSDYPGADKPGAASATASIRYRNGRGPDDEATPAVGGLLRDDRAAVGSHDLGDDRQPQARATGGPRA